MTRHSALDRLKENAQDPIYSIPSAQKKKREERVWEKANRGASYFIPAPLNEQAKDIRASILALAQRHMTTTSSVAAALMNYALREVRLGKLILEARPDATRRKMTLTLEDAKEWPQEIPQVKPKKVKSVKDLYLGYRWGRDMNAQIKALADNRIPAGEVVVFLLNYALAEYKNGNCKFQETAITLAQEVSIP
jgi:hypothetical protein